MELTRKNYFSKEMESLYLGSSSFKAWNQCEAKKLAELKGEWQDKENLAFLLGNYVHSWSSGDLQEFIIDHPELFKKNSKELLKKYALGDKMIDVLKNDPLVEKVREGEKEQIFTGKIAGVPFKIQVDIFNIEKGYFADIKTTKCLTETYWNSETRERETFIDRYDYHTQIAIYSEILRQNLGMNDYLDCYLIAVDKQDIPDHEVIYTGKSFIKEKLEFIENSLSRIINVREGIEQPFECGKCEYCRSKKKLASAISLDTYRENLGL